MPKSMGQKLKILHLISYFYSETYFNASTGEAKGLTVNQLIERLEKDGIPAERKTLYSDLSDIKSFGIELASCRHGRQTYYYAAGMPFDFEMSELKILVDAVQSAKFISERQSNIIIEKLEKLCPKDRCPELRHNVSMNGRVKTMNSSSIYAVDSINSAINRHKKLSFDYYRWVLGDEKLQKKNKVYIVNPIALVFDDGNYYLIAHNGESENPLRHYRVDKMKNVQQCSGEIDCDDFLADFDLNAYIQSVFGMFGSANEQLVMLKAPKELIGVFKDRFSSFEVTEFDDESFTAEFNVRVSAQFFGWLLGLSGVQILAPAAVKEQYLSALQNAIDAQKLA